MSAETHPKIEFNPFIIRHVRVMIHVTPQVLQSRMRFLKMSFNKVERI